MTTGRDPVELMLRHNCPTPEVWVYRTDESCELRPSWLGGVVEYRAFRVLNDKTADVWHSLPGLADADYLGVYDEPEVLFQPELEGEDE